MVFWTFHGEIPMGFEVIPKSSDCWVSISEPWNPGALEPAVGLQSSINYLPFSDNNDGQGEQKAKRFPAHGCLYLCGTSVKPRPAIS